MLKNIKLIEYGPVINHFKACDLEIPNLVCFAKYLTIDFETFFKVSIFLAKFRYLDRGTLLRYTEKIYLRCNNSRYNNSE